MMKRRKFIKTVIIAASVLTGLPERMFRFGGNRALASNSHDERNPDYSGSYFSEMVHDSIVMPEELLIPLKKTGFDIVAVKGNGFLLIPVNNPLIKLFDEIGNSKLFKEDFLLLRGKDIHISDDGAVGIPRGMQKFAGVEQGKVSIVGIRNMIEIVNAGK